ncbi:hypothetical protein [Thalassotalea sp. PLHSN55]|uniref:hypothetical protein n=1 Tax=Thalassotalea sp. PLHSN55 TaxID=3435888 RepID=UPI003F82B803
MKNISLKHITFAVVTTALLSTYVSADDVVKNTLISVESTTEHQLEFTVLDSNQDGKISQVEAQKSKQLYDAFAKADTNGDATLNREEFADFITNSN